MKSFIVLVLFLVVFSKAIKIDGIVDEANYGCKLSEGEGKNQCCWVNSNGCCKPPSSGQACPMVITTCCKKRVVDENGVVTYVYSHSYGSTPTDTM